ncbi:hypothetical protein L218DRAFT_874021, partial [Marasmius fiardii PR-910]
SKPNDHFAAYNPEILAYWEPLTPIIEMPGEQFNGKFQKINTNNKICKFLGLNLW